MHIIGFLRATRLEFVKKEHDKDDIYTFFFSASRPLKHIAGQHGLFVLSRLGGVRVFSLSSAPEEKYVAISTYVRAGSRYKQRLGALKSGDHLTMWGPVLNFIFQKKEADYVFLAQGIGITPFRSLLVHADKAQLPVSTTLIHVDGSAHTFKDLTSRLASKAYYPTNPEEFTTAVTQTLNLNAQYYLSGSPKFIRATKKTLRSLGMKRSQMRKDGFLGY